MGLLSVCRKREHLIPNCLYYVGKMGSSKAKHPSPHFYKGYEITKINIMVDDLKEYYEAEKILVDDINNNRIQFDDLKERLPALWKLIPTNIDLNPVGLYRVIEGKFHYEWNKQKVTYKIDVGTMSPDEAKKRLKKFVKRL